jgi:hypothetical protein
MLCYLEEMELSVVEYYVLGLRDPFGTELAMAI